MEAFSTKIKAEKGEAAKMAEKLRNGIYFFIELKDEKGAYEEFINSCEKQWWTNEHLFADYVLAHDLCEVQE